MCDGYGAPETLSYAPDEYISGVNDFAEPKARADLAYQITTVSGFYRMQVIF